MMGTKTKQSELFSYNVNLEERIGAEHPLRRVLELIDFSFVREDVRDFYGTKGNVSVDPEVIIKLMFLLFFDDIKSERELMRVVPLRLDYLWFLGYSLDDEIPDHSVLSKARAKWGKEVFEKLFIKTIEQCALQGLIGGDKIHIDSSYVRGNASKDAVVKGPPILIKQLKEAYGVQEKKLSYSRPVDRQKKVLVNDCMVNKTDPDLAMVHKIGEHSLPRYKHHRAVDDAHGVITAIETTSGDVSDEVKLLPLISQHEDNTGNSVKTVIGDSRYGTIHNFRECARKGIRSHMRKMHKSREKSTYKNIFGEKEFKFIQSENCYICPAGQKLMQRSHNKDLGYLEYAAPRNVCRECPLRKQCTQSKHHGRRLLRHTEHDLIEQAYAQSASKAAIADRIRRSYLIEGSFAQAANNFHFKRSRWRRLHKQSIQDSLIAAIQNINLLIKKRHFPNKVIDMVVKACVFTCKWITHLFFMPLCLRKLTYAH